MLKDTYKIPAANFIGHSDIAPVRKVDPNKYFPWEQLARNGYGLWYDAGVLEAYASYMASLPADTFALAPDTSAATGSLVTADSAVVGEPLFYPEHFDPQEALRIIGYDTQDMGAAIRAFKLHFIQTDTTAVLTEPDKIVLYNLYKKYI